MVHITFAVLVLTTCVSAQGSESLFTCPKGIATFSYQVEDNKYYKCDETSHAVLTQCPKNMTYVAEKKGCFRTTGSAQNGIEIKRHAVLGRGFVGDLYNSNENRMHTGSSLWRKKTVEAEKIRTLTPSLSVKVFRTKGRADRLDNTQFSEALKTDIVGGLVHVEGSWLYLDDKLKSLSEVVVILTYHETTTTNSLPTHVQKDYDCPEHINKIDQPTHVISAVTSGVGVNFLFRKKVQSNETAERVAMELEEAIIMMKTKSRIGEKMKRIIASVTVDIYSDIVFKTTPSTVEEAMSMYRSLPMPMKISKYTNITVPYALQLTPIEEYCAGYEVKHVDVAEDILDELQYAFDEIAQNELTIQTLQTKKVVRSFRPLFKPFSLLLRKLKSFELKMKKQVQINIPLVRHGENGEEILVKILNDYHASPFENDRLEEFLRNRKQEVEQLEFILNPAKFQTSGIKIVTYDQASDMRVVFTKAFVVLLRFNILPSKTLVRRFLNGEDIHEERSWYKDPSTISVLGRALKQFTGLASTNLHMKDFAYLFAVGDWKNKSFDTIFQREGLIYQIQMPDTPLLPPIKSLTHESITLLVTRPLDSWITGVKISYWDFGHPERTETKTQRFSGGDTTLITVNGLKPGKHYKFEMQFLTLMGTSQPSEAGEFTTRGCGPPINVRPVELEANSVTLSWDTPQTCGKEVVVRGYNVTITGARTSPRSFVVARKTTCVVSALSEASIYTAEVSTMFNRSGDVLPTCSLPSVGLKIITLPATLQHLSLIYRTKHSARVSWSGCTRVATSGKLLGYRVRYSMTNDIYNGTYNGTEVNVMTNDTSYVMTDLMQGTTYAVSVQVVTSLGSSQYTPNLILTTMQEKGEIEVLREKIEREIKEVDGGLRRSMMGMNSTLSDSITKAKTELSRSIQTATKNISSSIETVKDALTTAIDEVKSDFQKRDTNLTAWISKLSNDIKAQRPLVEKYGVIFVGHGIEERCESDLSYSTSSLSDCLSHWRDNRPGKDYNGITFYLSGSGCWLQKNEKGHSPRKQYFHFNFVQ